MTHAKKFKKKIRARARRTGERYTAARRQVLAARVKRRASASTAEPQTAPRQNLTRGAVSEAKVLERTGQPLGHWFAVLDAFDAKAKGHTAAARHLGEAHGVDGWYSQGITVAYERLHGLRALNQRPTGDYEVSVSKVVPATPLAVAEAFNDASHRERWLVGQDQTIATGLRAAGKPMAVVKDGAAARLRCNAGAGTSTVAIHVDAKPNGRASVVAQVMKLAKPEDVEERRAAWRAALESLKASLE